MPDIILPNLSLELPDVGGDQDTWGDISNANWVKVDNIFSATGTPVSLSSVSIAALAVTGALTATGVGNKIAVTGTGSTFAVNPAAVGSLNNVAIGASIRAIGNFTNLDYTGTLTGGTGAINIGMGQIFKGAEGNVGVGTAVPIRKFMVTTNAVAGVALFESTAGTTVAVGLRNTGSSALFPQILGINDDFAIQTNGAERLRIDSTGFFKVSNTGVYVSSAGQFHEFNSNQNNFNLIANSTSTGAAVVNVSSILPAAAGGIHYAAYTPNTGSLVYRVLANGNVQNTNNSYGAISDAKLKENVTDASSYLDRFMQVRFRNFNFIGSDLKQFGVIAQELEQVFPGLVEESPDFEQVTRTRTVEVPAVDEVLDEEGNVVTPAQPATTREEEYTESVPTGTFTKSVKYSILAQIQGKVIQEQQALIQDLADRVAALEAN